MAVSIGPRIGIDGEAEYRKQLNNIIASTKNLDKQMEALKSSFTDETSAMEKNARETELLQKQKEKLTEEVDQMRAMVERSIEATGEDSTQTQKWEASLAAAETQLNNVNAALDEHIEAAEELRSPLGELNQTIEEQTNELEDLRDAYVNAVLEFGEGSDQANELAGQITELSASLEENQSRLDEATASADALTGSMSDASEATSGIGEAAQDALGAFSPAMAGIVTAAASGDLIGTITAVVDTIREIGEAAIESVDEFESAQGTLSTLTGLIGDELEEATSKARTMWAAIANEDLTQEQAVSIQGSLMTAFGWDADTAAQQIELFSQFSEVTGVDGVKAVDAVSDAMKSWGMVTGDTETDIETMTGLLNDLVTASENMVDVNVGSVASSLSQYSSYLQNLGLDLDDVIALLIQYDSVGGNWSTMMRGLFTAAKNLHGEVEDMPAAFQAALETIQSTSNEAEVLDTKIGDTGLTIADVFGERNVQDMVHRYSQMKDGSVDYSDALKDNETALSDVGQEMITVKDKFAQAEHESEAVLQEGLRNAKSGRDVLFAYLDSLEVKTQGLITVTNEYMSQFRQMEQESQDYMGVLQYGNMFNAQAEGYTAGNSSATTNNNNNTTYEGSTINVYGGSATAAEIAQEVSDYIYQGIQSRL